MTDTTTTATTDNRKCIGLDCDSAPAGSFTSRCAEHEARRDAYRDSKTGKPARKSSARKPARRSTSSFDERDMQHQDMTGLPLGDHRCGCGC